MPCYRLRIRTLMIAVAVLATLLGALAWTVRARQRAAIYQYRFMFSAVEHMECTSNASLAEAYLTALRQNPQVGTPEKIHTAEQKLALLKLRAAYYEDMREKYGSSD